MLPDSRGASAGVGAKSPPRPKGEMRGIAAERPVCIAILYPAGCYYIQPDPFPAEEGSPVHPAPPISCDYPFDAHTRDILCSQGYEMPSGTFLQHGGSPGRHSRSGRGNLQETEMLDKRNFYAPVLALIALTLLAGVVSAEEHQITNASVDQVYSTVLDDRILWSDNRTGDYDVYLYNLTEESERAVSPPDTDQFASALPAGMGMSGDRIVWEDNRSGNRDIYLYEIATGEESQITNETGHEVNPAVAGDWIVWQDNRNGNWDIYLYDIATGTETQITTDENVQMTPAVTESMVVWNDYRNGNWDIYAWTPDATAPSAPSGPGAGGIPAPDAPPAPGADPTPPPPGASGTTTPPTTSAPTVTSTATPTPTPEEDYEVGEVPPGPSPESQGGPPVTPVTWTPVEVTPRIPLPSELGDPPLVVTPTPPIPGPL
ncbi:hypothetical protein DIC75_00610 [Methanoculleus sp. CWC-02]|uniref:DUF5050 domain-containing protein n=2 Tax=Methanoculleus oceani TaxID=2184756 RepID=A0ABD4TCN6_9EURY|nr:hypothetical protein [Methanoculleus sp. CWC-02]